MLLGWKCINKPINKNIAFSSPCLRALQEGAEVRLPQTCTVLLTVFRELFIGPLVSGAVDRPCSLQELPCWVPSAGPFSCPWNVYSSAHSTPGAAYRPFSLGSRRSALFAAGPSVLGCRPIQLHLETCTVLLTVRSCLSLSGPSVRYAYAAPAE